MLGVGWSIFFSILFIILVFIFSWFNVSVSGEMDFQFENFKNTTSNENSIKWAFLGSYIIIILCVFLAIYSLNFMFADLDEYKTIETERFEFFGNHEDSNLYEILYSDEEIEMGIYKLALKNSENKKYIYEVSANNTELIYEDITQPYVVMSTKELKNFLYHNTIRETQVVLPYRLKKD